MDVLFRDVVLDLDGNARGVHPVDVVGVPELALRAVLLLFRDHTNVHAGLVAGDDGRVRPIVSRTEPLAHAVRALSAIAAREVVGKVVLTAGADPRA